MWAQNSTELIAPDLFCWRVTGPQRAKIRWVEAKTKSAFSWHRITKRWVTGIDLHHYEHYRQVAELSPWPIWLLFLHLDGRAKDSPTGSPVGLFGGDLTHLSKNENHRHANWGKSGMVYWAHEKLTRLATLPQVYSAMQSNTKSTLAARNAYANTKSDTQPTSGESASAPPAS